MLAIVAFMISDLAAFPISSRNTIKTQLLTPINLLKENDSEEIQRLANDLSCIITTGGAHVPDKSIPKMEETVADNLSDTCLGAELKAKMTISDWMQHLDDKILPLRSGALREVTKALKDGKIEKEESIERIEQAAYSAIHSPEPFLFLSGVEALATLGKSSIVIKWQHFNIFDKSLTQ